MSQKKNRNIVLFILISAVLLIVATFYFLNRKPGVSWGQTFNTNGKNPYDTYLLSRLLNSLEDSSKLHFIKKDLSTFSKVADSTQISPKKNTYFFLSKHYYINEDQFNILLKFVEKGNNAFIASCSLPYSFEKFFTQKVGGFAKDSAAYSSWGYTYKTLWIGDTLRDLNFTSDHLFLEKPHELTFYPGDSKFYQPTAGWAAFDSLYTEKDTSNQFQKLGYANQDEIIFFSIKHGKGNLYFHTIPLAFTNYFLREKEGKDYVERALAYTEGDFYWDKYNAISYYKKGNRKGSPRFDKGPMWFILTHESLRWAWYIILVMVLLYVVVQSRRKQKIIPLVDPKLNTSLDFVKTVGRLYFKQENHKKLAMLKMKLFLGDIRNQFHISTSHLDAEFEKKLRKRSGVNERIIRSLIVECKKVSKKKYLSKEELIDLNEKIERFNQFKQV